MVSHLECQGRKTTGSPSLHSTLTPSTKHWFGSGSPFRAESSGSLPWDLQDLVDLHGSAWLGSVLIPLSGMVKFFQNIILLLEKKNDHTDKCTCLKCMEAVLLPKGMGGGEDENGPECFLTASYFKQPRPRVHWVFFCD